MKNKLTITDLKLELKQVKNKSKKTLSPMAYIYWNDLEQIKEAEDRLNHLKQRHEIWIEQMIESGELSE